MCFNCYDTNGSGSIDNNELTALIVGIYLSLGYDPDVAATKATTFSTGIFSNLGKTGDDQLTVDEFKQMVQLYPVILQVLLCPVPPV